jgi:L-ornithine N5-monooxygenase
MKHRHVELLAIGAGPSNLALAVALEELAPDDLARNSLLIEQQDAVRWQPGMLLPWARSQVSFLKDLVTWRNPRSQFSFVNYLHDTGRLDSFINLGSFTPYRMEVSGYLQWVALSLTKVQVEYGRRCTDVVPSLDPDGRTVGWTVRLTDGSTISCRYLIIGAGRDANIPPEFAEIPPDRLIHSTQYTAGMNRLDPELPHRIVVIGGAQSAAEMLWATHEQLPNSQCTMIMRSIGLSAYGSSKFVNERYYPGFVSEFFDASPDARRQVLQEMHGTNYAGLAPDLLDAIYRQMYLQKLTGDERLRMLTMADVTSARMDDGEIVLTIHDRMRGLEDELRCDVVLLGTGFVRDMPSIASKLCAELGLDEALVTRNYRLVTSSAESSPAQCYLQGVNEATHGIADSLLSVLASRGHEITRDILAHRQESTRPRVVRGAVDPATAINEGDMQWTSVA